MQVKSAAGLRGRRTNQAWKCEPAQAPGKKGEGRGLIRPEKKVAATLIGQYMIPRTTRLPCPTQSNAPGNCAQRIEI